MILELLSVSNSCSLTVLILNLFYTRSNFAKLAHRKRILWLRVKVGDVRTSIGACLLAASLVPL